MGMRLSKLENSSHFACSIRTWLETFLFKPYEMFGSV